MSMEQIEATPAQAPSHVVEVPPPPDPAQRPARLALYLGVLLIAVGLVALYLGYNGVATNANEVAQTPYLISGGMAGLGLLGLGGISVAVFVLLRVQADLRRDLTDLRETVDSLTDAVGRQGYNGSNGHAPSANGTVMVTEGSRTFHRPDCRLVTRAGHARPVAKSETGGLTPCRICRP